MTNFLWGNKDVLGLNERNLKYIRPYNNAHSKKIADDKLLTKKILLDNSSHFWENALGLFTSNDNLVDTTRLKSSLLRHENAHNEARRNTLWHNRFTKSSVQCTSTRLLLLL